MKTATYEMFIEANNNREIYNQDKRMEAAKRFPYTVITEGSYPEGDFAHRWCWQNFGPMDCEECHDSYSEYPGCPLVLATGWTEKGTYKDKDGQDHAWEEKRYRKPEKHSHKGNWTVIWLGKVGYDYGFSEYYFVNESDRDAFLSAAPSLGFGENYE